MQFDSFIGIDVSKETIDVAICLASKPDKFSYHKFTNKLAGYKALLAWLKEQGNIPNETFFLMEHTGSYTLEFCCFLEKKQLSFALVSPLHLQRSIGLQRGKNDKVDAKRIAEYAFLHRLTDPVNYFTPYKEIHQWLEKEHNIRLSYAHVHDFVHEHLGAKLKVVRKSNLKKDLALEEKFKKN